jgi:hypothetical protein
MAENNKIVVSQETRKIVVVERERVAAPIIQADRKTIAVDNENQANITAQVPNPGIIVIGSPPDTNISISHPITRIVDVVTAGPQGQKGDKGDKGDPGAIGSASGLEVDDYLIIKNAYTRFELSNSNNVALNISSSAATIVRIQDINQRSLFEISGSGVVQFATQSAAPSITENATPGKLWFTSTDFYVSLD